MISWEPDQGLRRADHTVELAYNESGDLEGDPGIAGRRYDGAETVEIAPLSSMVFAEIVDEAGLPPGVFNLVNGDGEGVG